MVLGLHQTARIVLSRYVTKPDIPRERAEERNSISNEHRHSSDNDALNEPCAQEPLNRDPAVDIDVVDTISSEL